MGNGIWYPAYSLDRLLAVAVPFEPRATWLAVALALLLVFVTMGAAPEDPGPAERRAMTVAGRCVPRPTGVLTVLSVRVSSSLDQRPLSLRRCRGVLDRNHDLVLDFRHAGS
jgi:hypothetical protein